MTFFFDTEAKQLTLKTDNDTRWAGFIYMCLVMLSNLGSIMAFADLLCAGKVRGMCKAEDIDSFFKQCAFVKKTKVDRKIVSSVNEEKLKLLVHLCGTMNS